MLICEQIPDTAYHRDIYLVVGRPKEASEIFKKKTGVDIEIGEECDDGAFHRIEEKNGKSKFIIWLKIFNGSPESISVLVHEALHLTFSVMQYVGVKFHRTYSEEAYTYYQDGIVKCALELLRTKKRKK